MLLTETPEGVLLPIKVTPKAKQTQIGFWENGFLKIKVTAPPEDGEANRAIVVLLSKTLEIPQRDIVLVRGSTSRIKLFLIIGLTQKILFERLSL